MEIGRQEARLFARRLLRWWRANGATYPWRTYDDPWRILITEILLRKTQAQKVSNLLEGVLSVLHSPKDAARLGEAELANLLRPFGMHRIKARDIRALATEVDRRGAVPSDLQELKELPGVGDYIANAVLCFGFGKRRPLIDVNVIRVFQRYFGVVSSRPRPHTDSELWDVAEELLPGSSFREYNWAIFDLAKTVCKHSVPECHRCPLARDCLFASDPTRTDQAGGGAKSISTTGMTPPSVPMRVNSTSVRP